MKKDLREHLLRKRDGIKPEKKNVKEASIRKRLYASADFRKAKGIMFYASFRSEAETMPCISQALKLKKMVLLPLVDRERKTLRIFQISELSELAPGFMGIPEPKARRTRERHLDDVEVVLIPGAGFDSEGNRLGYGAGYYDRLLSKAKRNITKIALAFEEQIVPEIPSERHDIRMDKIITDKRTIDCKKKLKIKNQNAK